MKRVKHMIIAIVGTVALFVTGCGAPGSGAGQETERGPKQEAESGSSPQESAGSWNADYSRLDTRYTLALATERNLYGCYVENGGVLVDQINRDSLSVDKTLILPGAFLISGMSADQEGNVYLLDNREEGAGLWKIDAGGRPQEYADIELEDAEEAANLFLKGIYGARDGNLYVWCEMAVPEMETVDGIEDKVWHWEDRVYVKDSQMNTSFYKKIAEIRGSNVLSFQISQEGTPLLLVKDEDGVYMQEIDAAGGGEQIRLTEAADSFGGEYLYSPENIASVENGFLYCQGNELWEFHYDTQEAKKILNLSSYGISSSDILFLAKNKDTYEIIDNHGDGECSELISLAFGGTEKTILTPGTTMTVQDLEEAVSEFNRYNGTYRVEIVDYIGQTEDYDEAAQRLKLDVVTGKAPDIIAVSGIDYSMFSKKGVLADLYDFMQEDEECSKDMLVPSVAKAYEDGGHLYSIAPSFLLHSMWGYADVTEGRDGVTFEELLRILEKNGRDLNAIAGFSADEPVLTRLCTVSMDEFVDWEKGICDFEGDYFKRVLSFAKEYKGNYTGGTYSERIRGREIVMSVGLISSVSNYQIQKELYDGRVAFIGYPVARGTGTAIAFRSSAVAINAQKEDQTGAWEFVKFYLLQGYDGQGFPVIQEQFDQVMEAAMEEDYIVTGEAGRERIQKEYYNDGGGEIFVYAAAQEDVNIIRGLVENAQNRFESHPEIQNIINEEAEAYFSGQVDLDRTAEKIQNRVFLLLQE